MHLQLKRDRIREHMKSIKDLYGVCVCVFLCGYLTLQCCAIREKGVKLP